MQSASKCNQFFSLSQQKGSAEWYESLIARYKPEDGASIYWLIQVVTAFIFICWDLSVWLSRRCSPQTLEEQLKKLVQIVDYVCADVHRAQNIYNKLFYRRISTQGFTLEKKVDMLCIVFFF